MSHRIAIVIEEPNWRETRALPARIKQAAARALRHVAKDRRTEALTILLTGDARLKALNLTFLRKDKSTNVLSFPAKGDDGYLGDIAIAFGVAAAEARDAGKTLADHAAHLTVHGVLHLLGYDHETVRDARAMEPLETAILAELGIPDPYARRTRAA